MRLYSFISLQRLLIRAYGKRQAIFLVKGLHSTYNLSVGFDVFVSVARFGSSDPESYRICDVMSPMYYICM